MYPFHLQRRCSNSYVQEMAKLKTHTIGRRSFATIGLSDTGPDGSGLGEITWSRQAYVKLHGRIVPVID